MDEYIAEQHAELVAAYRQAEQAQAPATVWPERPAAVNRAVVFDATQPKPSK